MSNIIQVFSIKKTLILFFLLIIQSAWTQETQKLLEKADKLFQERKYTDALEIYEKIFEEKKVASTAMLHKLSFIHEGLNNYTETLYYLSLYNSFNPSNETLKHIEDIAHEHRLKGYTNSDLDFILVFYKYYGLYILLTISLISFFLLFRIIIKRIKMQEVSKFTFPLILLLSILIFFSFDFTQTNLQAIIFENQTIIMDSPSAGGKIIDVVNEGHRLEVRSKIDIWYEVIWKDKKAYIRESNLRLVGLNIP